MSDDGAWTVVQATGSHASHAIRGHHPRAQATAEAERHAKAEITRWQDMLRDLKAGHVRVYQQTGLYKVKNRTELTP